MSRLHESAPLLQYPAAASHFLPPQQRSDWSAQSPRQPYQALHVQHRNALLQQQQQQREREQQLHHEEQQRQHYTFAPRPDSLLYDGEEESEGSSSDADGQPQYKGSNRDYEDDSDSGADLLTLQRAVHSTQLPASGAVNGPHKPPTSEHIKRGLAPFVRDSGVGSSSGSTIEHGAVDAKSALKRHSPTQPLGKTSYGSTAQTTAAAANGTTGGSQSQPHSPVTRSAHDSHHQSSSSPALEQLHLPRASADPNTSALSGVKDLDDPTPSSSPVPRSAPFSALSLSSHHARLAFYLLLSVVIAVANAITWKKTLNRFRATDGSSANLEFFVTEWTILLYVVLAAAILAYRWLFTALITSEQKAYPQRKFAMMGLCDAVAGLCSSLGGAFTSGQTQVILNQANIPVTMLLSRSFLASNYTVPQYVGAALIVCGSLMAAVPSSSPPDGSSTSTLWYGPLILLLSCLPNSFSNVYKEHNFKVDGLDVYYLTTFVSVWQVLLGCLFCPILSLPGLGGLSLSDIPANFAQGWQCFVGGHVEGYECHLSPAPYVVLLLYVVVNFFHNVLLLLITKHGSALLLVIASAISLPFTNLVFCSKLFMGREAERWSWWTGAGLLVVVMGFLLYSLVTDKDSGDWLPAQGAAGQMVFIVEEPVELQKSFSRARRHSFDVTDSPLVMASLQQRKRAAQQRFIQQRKSSRAEAEGVIADDTYIRSDPSRERLFFTPP